MPTEPAPASPVQASAVWTSGLQFRSDGSSGHEVLFDSDRKTNEAPGPMEMVLRSLCACSATDIVIVLRKARQTWSGVTVSAEGERAPEPPEVYSRIRLHYRVRGAVDPAVVERAVKLSREKYCSVLAMLRTTAEISFAIELDGAAAS